MVVHFFSSSVSNTYLILMARSKERPKTVKYRGAAIAFATIALTTKIVET